MIYNGFLVSAVQHESAICIHTPPPSWASLPHCIPGLQVITEASSFPVSTEPQRLSSQESACNAGDAGLTPGLRDPMEKEMATNSSVFAWEIPWTEEPRSLVHGVTKESDTT